MKNVLIVSGHPDLKISVSNKMILDELEARLPQAEIRKLDELYPTYQFDIEAEHAALEKADIVIFQYPMHWYSVPGLMKLYIDKVMGHGWAYGSKGKALAGKALIVSLTTGAPEAAYSDHGIMEHSVEEFGYFLEKFAVLCKMNFKKMFYNCGMLYVPGVTTDEQKFALIDKARKQAADLVEYVKGL